MELTVTQAGPENMEIPLIILLSTGVTGESHHAGPMSRNWRELWEGKYGGNSYLTDLFENQHRSIGLMYIQCTFLYITISDKC